MALPKPQLNGDVLDYDELQTAEMNRIADYVVENGRNENGSYEKWNSGKLVQWGAISKVVTMNVADGSLFRTPANITQNIPIPFVGRYETLFGLRSYQLAGIYTNEQQNTSFTFYPRSTVVYSNVTISGSFHLIGRWK